jgi:plastocyanin domain-containing protein
MQRILWTSLAVLALIGCGGSPQPAADSNRVAISVTDEGYEPQNVTVAAGKPVTLVVTRKSAKTCATEIVMPEYGINKPLPLGETVEITFTPTKSGEIAYACAMDMYKGTVTVK